jgi:hypothetical protein
MATEELQALHLAEDALHWAAANAALLLHGEGLRSRAVRRYLMNQGLFDADSADRLLMDLVKPVYAAHVLAPLMGGPLLKAWLAHQKRSPDELLADPPPPTTMLFELRFLD